MQYMGGKAKIARRVVQAILDDTPRRATWLEPFVGGGNVMEHAAPHFGHSEGMDAHPDLILMWQAAAGGWVPPEVTRERYAELRLRAPSAERGFAGFGASFGGKWFGGYSGDHVRTPGGSSVVNSSVRAVARQGEVFRKYGTVFQHMPFGGYVPLPGTVVYCDPPYAGTTGYSTGDFDHRRFYLELSQWAAQGCSVYVSEYTQPGHVPTSLIWSREKRNVLDRADNSRIVTELLFRVDARTDGVTA